MTVNDELETRRLLWDACLNVRDLGGFDTRDGGVTRRGAIVRMDNPVRLTAEGAEALVAYGVRTVIDLRTPVELTIDPPQFGTGAPRGDAVVSVHAPFGTNEEWEGLGVEDLEPASARYLRVLEAFPGRVATVVRAIADAPAGGIAIHCHSGKDRTGLIVALLLALVGVAPKEIAADYALSSAWLAPATEAWLEHGPGTREEREREVARTWTYSEVMFGVLDGLEERYGGAAGYLRWAGVEPEVLARLRARLVEDAGSTGSR
jgi:protein-tyrosine phosphatase